MTPHGMLRAGHDAMYHFKRFLDLNSQMSDFVDIKAYLSLWFMGAPFEHIRHGNVAELMVYGFWYRTRCVGV